ncbi:MAG: helix-turn-helix domain-containing protein [Acidimicrobiia bacterium]
MVATEQTTDGIELTPDRIKGLAHPTRIAMLGILRMEGPSTASELAKHLDTNSGATSYHLRQLERHGFVSEDPTLGNARQRFWKARHTHTAIDPVTLREDRDGRVLLDELARLGSALREAELQEWMDTQDDWGREWQDAVALDDFIVRLTSNELRDLVESLLTLIKKRASIDPGDVSPGASMVRLHLLAFPVADPAAAIKRAKDGLES